MSMRYQAGIVLPGYNALKVANAPTIGTVTAGSQQVSVAFTAPSCTGGSVISTYTAYCTTTGTKTATGASSPIVVTGLTNGTAYTFKVIATNIYGPSYPSAASASVTPVQPVGQQAYTCVGSYSWVAPTGVTSVSVVAVGSGGSSQNTGNGGGGLGYKNNITVVPGNSYTVVVGGKGPSSPAPAFPGQDSYFCSTSVVKGGGGGKVSTTSGGTYTGDGGGNGGTGGSTSCYSGGGGGAGGYSGNGGNGGSGFPQNGSNGSGGGGGGGASEGSGYSAGGGGGVGILGQGSNGAGGTTGCSANTYGRGGSGGSNASFKTGGAYGGGSTPVACGAGGAVRIIWPGTTRSFPSTCTGNL